MWRLHAAVLCCERLTSIEYWMQRELLLLTAWPCSHGGLLVSQNRPHSKEKSYLKITLMEVTYVCWYGRRFFHWRAHVQLFKWPWLLEYWKCLNMLGWFFIPSHCILNVGFLQFEEKVGGGFIPLCAFSLSFFYTIKGFYFVCKFSLLNSITHMYLFQRYVYICFTERRQISLWNNNAEWRRQSWRTFFCITGTSCFMFMDSQNWPCEISGNHWKQVVFIP